MKNKKLKGEFVCLEVRDKKNNIVGVDVFYNGIFQHRWNKL
jgi:hypothetical protein